MAEIRCEQGFRLIKKSSVLRTMIVKIIFCFTRKYFHKYCSSYKKRPITVAFEVSVNGVTREGAKGLGK